VGRQEGGGLQRLRFAAHWIAGETVNHPDSTHNARNGDFERYGLWLLKNSFAGNSQK
jgi:hypothetical protein